MTESTAILEGFDALCAEGKSAALATVVQVTGSSYRRPGARMLVAEDGRTWGGVSGGCLERDVARRCRQLIGGRSTAIVRYDTTDEDDPHAVATGCAGVIDLFLEPIAASCPGPIHTLRRVITERRSIALATVICGLHPASRIAWDGASNPSEDLPLSEGLHRLLQSGDGGIRKYDDMEVFFELLQPPQSLVIFGDGPDVAPVVEMARILGWYITVVHRHQPLPQIALEPDAAVVLMTHSYSRDLELLAELLARPPRYLGVLGPRRRLERLVSNDPEAMRQIYSPVGLDLGADTPQTIALSIIAEIQAVIAARLQRSLRDKSGPIYPRADGEPVGHASYPSRACPISA